MRHLAVFVFFAFIVSSCKSPEARRPESQQSGSYIEEAVERNKALVAEEEQDIQEIIEEDSLRDYYSSPNGFWYFYNKKDTTSTESPEFGDLVEFDYNIQTLDGRTIYTREELSPKIYAMDQEELFGGLREGLKLMREGETVTFLFPSHKAFGYYGDRDRIGKNVPVKSTVTLREIKEKDTNQNNN